MLVTFLLCWHQEINYGIEGDRDRTIHMKGVALLDICAYSCNHIYKLTIDGCYFVTQLQVALKC